MSRTIPQLQCPKKSADCSSVGSEPNISKGFSELRRCRKNKRPETPAYGTGVLGIEPSSPNFQTANAPTLTIPTVTEKTKYGTKSTGETAFSPELQAVVNAWPELPEALKAGIMAMVKASAGSKPG